MNNRYLVFVGEDRPALTLCEGDWVEVKAYEPLLDAFETIKMKVANVERCPDCLMVKGDACSRGRDVRVVMDLNLRNHALDAIKVSPVN